MGRLVWQDESVEPTTSTRDPVDTAVTTLDEGGFVVLIDDLATRPVGQLVVAADAMTTEHLAFMVGRTTGIICVAITGSVPKKEDNPAVPITIAEQVE